MPENIHADLRVLTLFKTMEEATFERLMRHAYIQNFPPQIDLIVEGDPADFLHVVVSGHVELYATWNRRETSMASLRPVSTFILAATIRDAPYLMAARTLERSRIVLLPSADVRAAFDTDVAFAKELAQELGQCYRSVVKHTKDLKLRSAVERLANYLLRLQGRHGDAAEVTLPIEKRKVASHLGMTPENLSRALKTLQGYGVKVDGNLITIGDKDDLTRFAKPTPLIDDYSC